MTDYKLTLAQRDLYLVHIEELIKDKQQFLFDKYNETHDLQQDNDYLKVIRNDYKHYYDYIKSQKREQITAMQFLNDYLDQIVEQGELTDRDLEKTRMDQRKILDEIEDIKIGLDELTENRR
jgi:hypothetical protein